MCLCRTVLVILSLIVLTSAAPTGVDIREPSSNQTATNSTTSGGSQLMQSGYDAALPTIHDQMQKDSDFPWIFNTPSPPDSEFNDERMPSMHSGLPFSFKRPSSVHSGLPYIYKRDIPDLPSDALPYGLKQDPTPSINSDFPVIHNEYPSSRPQSLQIDISHT